MTYTKSNLVRKCLFVWASVLFITTTCTAQVEHHFKMEVAYLDYRYTAVQVDPGPNWKGYNLDNNQSGMDIQYIYGLNYRKKLMAGIGLGYLNFEGIHGISVFGDIGYLPLKTKISPLLNIKTGYSHIWNQYADGTGSAQIEFGAGVHYQIKPRLGIFLQSGWMYSQQAVFVPLRLGVLF